MTLGDRTFSGEGLSRLGKTAQGLLRSCFAIPALGFVVLVVALGAYKAIDWRRTEKAKARAEVSASSEGKFLDAQNRLRAERYGRQTYSPGIRP